MKAIFKTEKMERPSFCPVCFKLLDAATSVGAEDVPEPGDYTVCIGCANVLRFGEDMVLAESSLMEIPLHFRMEFAKIVTATKEFLETRR